MSVSMSSNTRSAVAAEPFRVDLHLPVVDTGSALTAQSGDSAGNANVSLGTTIAGERNTSSSTEDYLSVRSPVKPVILQQITAATIGGSTGANDIHLAGIVLLKNAGPATAILNGFGNESASATAITLTGSTTADTVYDFGGQPWLNTQGTLTVTASVTNTVVVLYRNAS